MNQERGWGTSVSSATLVPIHVQVWGSLSDPATNYKTTLNTIHHDDSIVKADLNFICTASLYIYINFETFFKMTRKLV